MYVAMAWSGQLPNQSAAPTTQPQQPKVQLKEDMAMKIRPLLMLGLLMLSGSALAEGGCPAGYTPINNGQNWTCIPGGNDAPAQQQPQQSLPPQPSGYWEKTWGAIAGDSPNGILGMVVGASSETQARSMAISDCEAKGGKNCKVHLVYHNQCAAFVTGDNGYSATGAASIDEAVEISMDDCQNSDSGCRVYYSACTDPIFHRY